MQLDLDAALQGEPIRLKNGLKAFIYNDLSRTGHKVLTEFPLRGYVILPRGIEPYCWTSRGRYLLDKEDEHDIAGMWYDDPNDILKSAYDKNKYITYIGCSKPVEVVGRHKNGNWLIEVDGSIVPATGLEGISIVNPDKSSAQIKAGLPLPIRVSEQQRVWFIRSAPVSNQLVVDSRNAHPAELHVRSGNCFRTKKDAQAWIDALTKLAGNEE